MSYKPLLSLTSEFSPIMRLKIAHVHRIMFCKYGIVSKKHLGHVNRRLNTAPYMQKSITDEN
jgi:hypothetical protein